MLKPLAIAVMGALAIFVLLSLVATPAVYYLVLRLIGSTTPPPTPTATEETKAIIVLPN